MSPSRSRRGFLAFALAVAAFPPVAARSSGKVARIAGIGWHRRWDQVSPFFQRLATHGFVEGKTLEVGWYFPRNYPHRADEQMPTLIADAIQWRPDAMATISSANVKRIRGATSIVPIVFGLVEDPVGDGLVASLGRPGGNVTGAALTLGALAEKRLELACELAPGARRIAATYFSSEGDQSRALHAMRAAATRLGRSLIEVDLSQRAGGVDAGLRRLAADGAEALVPLGFHEAIAVDSWEKMVAYQDRQRTPLIGWSPDSAALGAVAGMGEPMPDHLQRMADIMANVLDGRTPVARIPVSATSRVELHINRTAASRLGIEVPSTVLVRADRLY